MMPRAVEQIFTTRDRLVPQGWVFTVTASCLEIYNEEIRDLSGPTLEGTGVKPTKLDIKGDINGITIAGLQSKVVGSPADVDSVLSQVRTIPSSLPSLFALY